MISDEIINNLTQETISESLFKESTNFLLDKLAEHMKVEIEILHDVVCLDKESLEKEDVYIQISFRAKNKEIGLLGIYWKGMFIFKIFENKQYIWVHLLPFFLGERLTCLSEKDKSLITLHYENNSWEEPKWDIDECGEWEMEQYLVSPY